MPNYLYSLLVYHVNHSHVVFETVDLTHVCKYLPNLNIFILYIAFAHASISIDFIMYSIF